MKRILKSTLLKELIWLTAIVSGSALIEFIIIETLDLHPVLSIKIQGLIGLMLVGYSIRMLARILKTYYHSANSSTNGQDDIN